MNRIASAPAACLLGILALLGFAAPRPVAAQTANVKPATPMSTPRRGHTATLLTSGQVWIAGGIVSSDLTRTAATQRYDFVSNTWQSAGDLRSPRALHSATLLLSGKVLVAGGLGAESSAEIGDPATGLWSRVASLNVSRYSQVAIRLASGQVVVIGGVGSGSAPLTSIERYDPVMNRWTLAGNLRTARTDHTATLLADGKILITGGRDTSTNILATAELYDPATGLSTSTGSLHGARSRHSATLLKSGRVLIAQGIDSSTTLASAELYDPATGLFSIASPAQAARRDGSATLLPSGDMLMTGGLPTYTGNTPIVSSELFRTSSSSWSSALALTVGRDNHPATLLPNAEVLLTGGVNAAPLASVDLFPETWNDAQFVGAARLVARTRNTASLLPDGDVVEIGGSDSANQWRDTVTRYDGTSWSMAAPLPTPRGEHTATVLADGKVFVTGGMTDAEAASTGALLYDGAADSWRPRAAMHVARHLHRAVLLDSGKVLVAGGLDAVGNPIADVEIYDPLVDTWTAATSLPVPLYGHSMTVLASGRVLVFGGVSPGNGVQRRPQIYDPATNTWSRGSEANYPDGIADHAATLLADGSVLISGGAATEQPTMVATAATRLYFPASDSWQDGPDLRAARASHSATLLPSGKVLIAGGAAASGAVATIERYDPLGRISEASALWPVTGHGRHVAVLLNDGRVLLTGSLLTGSTTLRYDAYDYGVFGPAAITTATPHLHDGVALNLAGSGFAPALDAGLGRNRNSPSNVPVLQLMRVDNGLTRYVPVDPAVGFSDTSYAAAATALDGSANGPLRARLFVNGRVGSAVWTTRATVPGRPESPAVANDAPDGVTVSFAAPGYSGGAPITSYALEIVQLDSVFSCPAPCSAISVSGMSPGVYTGYLYARNDVGLSPATAAGSIVVRAVPSLALQSSANPSPVNDAVTLTAQLSSSLPAGGTIDFQADGQPLCSAVAIVGTAASCTTAALSLGEHTLTAHYAGDGLNTPATSPELTQTVQRRATTTSLSTACPVRIVEGQPYPVSAQVSGQDAGGDVAFTVDGAETCTTTLDAAGHAGCSLSNLSSPTPGPRVVAIKAVFSGNPTSAPSESAPLQVTVLDSADVIFRSDLEPLVAGCQLP
jgi:N-acetylneuraminic acid mutarotase